MLHRKVIETKIGNALCSLSFYHLLRLFFESIPLEKARSCCLQATIWVKSIVLWIRERYNLTTLLSLQPKINIKESITNVLSIILFIVFKYFDHFIALIFLYKINITYAFSFSCKNIINSHCTIVCYKPYSSNNSSNTSC